MPSALAQSTQISPLQGQELSQCADTCRAQQKTNKISQHSDADKNVKNDVKSVKKQNRKLKTPLLQLR